MFQACNCEESFNLRAGLGDGPSDEPLFTMTGYDEFGRPIAVDRYGRVYENTGGNDVSGAPVWTPVEIARPDAPLPVSVNRPDDVPIAVKPVSIFESMPAQLLTDPQNSPRDYVGPVFVPPQSMPAPAVLLPTQSDLDQVREMNRLRYEEMERRRTANESQSIFNRAAQQLVATAAPVVAAPVTASPAPAPVFAPSTPSTPSTPSSGSTGGGRSVVASQVAPPVFDDWGAPMPSSSEPPVQPLDAAESPRFGVGGLLTLAAIVTALFQ